MTAAAALPYGQFPLHLGPIPTFGLLVVHAARRADLPVSDALGLAGVLTAMAAVGAHLFDVAAYQLDDAARDPSLWFQFMRGRSLFGALAAIALPGADDERPLPVTRSLRPARRPTRGRPSTRP